MSMDMDKDTAMDMGTAMVMGTAVVAEADSDLCQLWSREDACAVLRWMIDMAQADAEKAGELDRNCITAINYAVKELNDIFDIRGSDDNGALGDILSAVREVGDA